VQTLVLALLLAFVLGQIIAWGYAATHTGLSYSRNYTQSLVLLSMVVALVMLVIGNNIITAFGLLGALAIIRFRNVLKDTRDTVFVFLTLVVGMAVGSEKFITAIVGTVAIVLVAVYLHYTAFGSLGRFDGHLSFLLAHAGDDDAPDVLALLGGFCRSTKQISVRHLGAEEGTEYVFQVRLADRGRSEELVEALRSTAGVSEVALILRDELSEV
jgi:uncharacterized membrane protein YhiD involved in acid resistance